LSRVTIVSQRDSNLVDSSHWLYPNDCYPRLSPSDRNEPCERFLKRRKHASTSQANQGLNHVRWHRTAKVVDRGR